VKVTVLGSGGFLPQPDRPLPGFAVEHEGKVYLFDAGEGTQVRMAEHGISSADLEAVVISHLHGDHLFGLPGVMVNAGTISIFWPPRRFVPTSEDFRRSERSSCSTTGTSMGLRRS